MLSVHWPLLTILAAGLWLRWPHVREQFSADMPVWESFASSILSRDPFSYYYHARTHPFPYNHPPLFPILAAPAFRLAALFGFPSEAAVSVLVYIFEIAGAVLIYALAQRALAPSSLATGEAPSETASAAGVERSGLVVPTLLAAIFYLAPLTPWWLEYDQLRDNKIDTHPVWIATAFLLVALWRRCQPAQAGIGYGLALATRSEMAFLGIPWTLHFLLRHGRRDAAAFALAAGAVAGAIILPFILRDPAGFDYALRGHLAPRLLENVPFLWRWPGAGLDEATPAAIRPYNSQIMFGAIAAATLVFCRDPVLERYLLLVSLTHVLTLPVFHNRYAAHVFALSLVYAARATRAPLYTAWLLVTTRTGLDALTLGLPWLAIAAGSLADARRATRPLAPGAPVPQTAPSAPGTARGTPGSTARTSGAAPDPA